MSEMPDLLPESKIAEQRKVIKYWINNCHYLETLLNEQKKIIADLQKQVRLFQEHIQEKPAPKNSRCVCCSNFAYIIAKCGHYFCSICTDRSHHIGCVECEKIC